MSTVSVTKESSILPPQDDVVHFPDNSENEGKFRFLVTESFQKLQALPPHPDPEIDTLTAKMQRLSCGGAFSKVQAAGQYVWNASVVEIPRVYFLKALSSISSLCFSQALFSEESL